MNIYLLKRTDYVRDDQYEQLVVVAESEEAALDVDVSVLHWPIRNDDIEVEYIGIADDSLEAGTVVCAGRPTY